LLSSIALSTKYLTISKSGRNYKKFLNIENIKENHEILSENQAKNYRIVG